MKNNLKGPLWYFKGAGKRHLNSYKLGNVLPPGFPHEPDKKQNPIDRSCFEHFTMSALDRGLVWLENMVEEHFSAYFDDVFIY